jgi:lambda family phage portal protein
MLERLIERVSPQWALRREAARAGLQQIRAYDAAKVGRRTNGWQAHGSSADSELAVAGTLVRNRARELVRNNPWAMSARRKLPAKVVGTGITPYLRTRDRGLRQRYADQWQWFGEASAPDRQLDFNGQVKQAVGCMFEAGECLLRFRQRPTSWRMKVPLQIEVLEPDYLDDTRTELLDNGNVIIRGIEFDPAGRRVAYWLFDEHPGELLPSRIGLGTTGFASKRVPADEVLHLYDPLRPGQVRGVSLFAPVALAMHDLEDMADARRMREKIAACFVAFVKRTASPTSPLGRQENDADGRRLEKMGPGIIQYMSSGDEVSFGTPPQSDGVPDYMKLELHAIAAGLGMTYMTLTGDTANSSFSSMRAGSIDFYDVLDHWQWTLVIPQVMAKVARKVDVLLFAMGERRAPGLPIAWATPRRRYIDPQKEIQAAKDGIRSGLMTLRQGIAETGEDPDQQLEEIADTNEQLDALEIVLDTDPRRTAAGGNPVKAEAEQPATEPAKTE